MSGRGVLADARALQHERYGGAKLGSAFFGWLTAAGCYAKRRRTKGRDQMAACGQLKSETEKLSVRERQALRAMAMTD